jgi:hypothetical protein
LRVEVTLLHARPRWDTEAETEPCTSPLQQTMGDHGCSQASALPKTTRVPPERPCGKSAGDKVHLPPQGSWAWSAKGRDQMEEGGVFHSVAWQRWRHRRPLGVWNHSLGLDGQSAGSRARAHSPQRPLEGQMQTENRCVGPTELSVPFTAAGPPPTTASLLLGTN